MNYLTLLDCCKGTVTFIRITEKEMEVAETYDDFERFMAENLEKKYDFRVKDCSWMLTDELTIIDLTDDENQEEEGGNHA